MAPRLPRTATRRGSARRVPRCTCCTCFHGKAMLTTLALAVSSAPVIVPAQDLSAPWALNESVDVAPAPLPVFRFATVYSDHMVLQREPSQASIWGFASAGASVSVKAGVATATTTANADGIWRASLPPQPASTTPVVLSASSGGKTIAVNDVLFGDVWVCSGQVTVSNLHARANGLVLMLACSSRC